MRKIFFTIMAIACACTMTLSAQEPDLEAIAKARKVKADSLVTMMAKVYATQAAMNHPGSEARATLLKAFDESFNLEKQDEQFKEGNSIATQFFKQAEGMKTHSGIDMSRKLYAQAVVERFNDTTAINMNEEVKAINDEARRLINEITGLKKDSAAVAINAPHIAAKSDSLSRNMGRFFGLQMRHMCMQKGLNDAQMARVLEGFNSGINVDETNKPLIDGRMMGTEFIGIQENIKKQLSLNLNKEIFFNTVKEVLSDSKVPTQEDFNAINNQTNAYFQAVSSFAKENSPEALTQKGLGKKYIDNLMEKDPKYIQAPSGLVYKVLAEGKGKKFEATDKIKVMYKGTHVDGKTFDESKEPVTFAPNQVVPGFREALLMMRPGAKMIAVLPQNLAYGARGAGGTIKPFETLVFEIETLGLDETAAKDAKTPTASQKPATKEVKAAKDAAKDTQVKTGKKAKKAKSKVTGKTKSSKKRK